MSGDKRGEGPTPSSLLAKPRASCLPGLPGAGKAQVLGRDPPLPQLGLFSPPRTPHSLHLASLAGVTLLRVLLRGAAPLASRVPQPRHAAAPRLLLGLVTGMDSSAFTPAHHPRRAPPPAQWRRSAGTATIYTRHMFPHRHRPLPVPPASLSGKSTTLGQPQPSPSSHQDC